MQRQSAVARRGSSNLSNQTEERDRSLRRQLEPLVGSTLGCCRHRTCVVNPDVVSTGWWVWDRSLLIDDFTVFEVARRGYIDLFFEDPVSECHVCFEGCLVGCGCDIVGRPLLTEKRHVLFSCVRSPGRPEMDGSIERSSSSSVRNDQRHVMR